MAQRPKLLSAIRENVLPQTDVTYNLGNSALRWLSMFVSVLTLVSLVATSSIQIGGNINWTSGSILKNTTWILVTNLSTSTDSAFQIDC